MRGCVDEFAVLVLSAARKRPILGLAAGATGALALHGLLWLAGSQVLRWQTASALANAAQHGWSVTTGDRVVGGWPSAATLTIEHPAITGGERTIPGGLAWSADRMVVRVSLLHPLTLVVAAQGQQFLRVSHAPDVGFVAARAEAQLGLWAGSQGWAAFQADGVAAGIAGSRNPQDVQIAALRLTMRQQRASAPPGGQGVTSVILDARAHGLGLPDVGRWALGATIAEAGAELVLVTLPPDSTAAPALAGRTRAAVQAAAWRDGGGRVRIDRARLRWGPLLVDGSAELGLDDDLQPAGGGQLQAQGTDAALDAAAGGGLIPPGVALTAKAVLGVMPHDGQGGVRLPFILRDRTVSVGHIPLARVGPIAW